MFPTCTSRSRQTFRSSRARTGSSMHSAAAVAHRGSQTLFASSRPCPTSGGVVRVPWGIAIFQPSYWRSIGSIIPSHHRHLCLRNCVDSRAPRSPGPLYEHGRVRQSFSARKASTSSTSITMEKRTSPSRLRTGQPIRAASLPSLLENPLRATDFERPTNSYFLSALQAGAVIGSKDYFAGGIFVKADSIGGVKQYLGNWVNVTNDYVGLRFKIAGKTHYGWARLTVQITSRSVIKATLTGYAYETIPNKPIIAGKTKGPHAIGSEADATATIPTPETTTLGLLALGSPGLSIWRREGSANSAQ